MFSILIFPDKALVSKVLLTYAKSCKQRPLAKLHQHERLVRGLYEQKVQNHRNPKSIKSYARVMVYVLSVAQA
jgi:hypothetical protein